MFMIGLMLLIIDWSVIIYIIYMHLYLYVYNMFYGSAHKVQLSSYYFLSLKWIMQTKRDVIKKFLWSGNPT